jgi:hypothetical protein
MKILNFSVLQCVIQGFIWSVYIVSIHLIFFKDPGLLVKKSQLTREHGPLSVNNEGLSKRERGALSLLVRTDKSKEG